MYQLTEQQIDYILNDIKLRGVEMEDLQLNLLDHICCIIEQEYEPNKDFESFYEKIIPRFFKKELKEIEEETILLLTFKNYYTMKKSMMVSGTVAVTALMLGSFFKIMHWPGAGMLLVLGIIVANFVFLPIMAILKSKEVGTKSEKRILFLGTFIGILFSNFVLFKVQHWPGANAFLFLSMILAFFVFLPIYFFNGIRKPEKKVNTLIFSMLLILVIGLQFVLVNTRPAVKQLQVKMHTYLQGEALLAKMQNQTSDSLKNKSESGKLIADINNYCQQIKGMILQNAIGKSFIPKDFEAQGILVEEGGLGPGFFDDGTGIKLLSELKLAVDKYNNSEMDKIPVEESILTIDFKEIERYSNYSVLSSLTQLQLYLAAQK